MVFLTSTFVYLNLSPSHLFPPHSSLPRRHVLQLNKEQAALFVTRMDELAAAGGWHKVAVRPEGVTEACEVYEASGAAV